MYGLVKECLDHAIYPIVGPVARPALRSVFAGLFSGSGAAGSGNRTCELPKCLAGRSRILS